jgi:formylglycine-generating enzyme required for sulfatase activity
MVRKFAPLFLVFLVFPANFQSEESPPQRFVTKIGLEFTYIPGGNFNMGSSHGVFSMPVHRVKLSPFYVSRIAVSKGMLRKFTDENKLIVDRDELGPDPSGWKFESIQQWSRVPVVYRMGPSDDHAVRHQSWVTAEAFAQWMSKSENRTFRLITEAQYEYVARSGVANGEEDYWWESAQPSPISCWLSDENSRFTAPEIGGPLFGLNTMTPWGVYWIAPMHYWMRDRMAEYSPEAVTDPSGPEKTQDGRRVIRGMTISDRNGLDENRNGAGIILESDIIESDHHSFVHHDPEQKAPIQEATEPHAHRNLPLADGLSLTLIEVPSGTFVLGRTQEEHPWSHESPETIMNMKEYWLGETDVTQEQFQAVTGINPSMIKGPHLPVHSVDVGEMLAFCDLLTIQERRSGRLGAEEEYRLPTEAEWERAALAGRRTTYCYGNDPAQLHWYAWFDIMDGPRDVALKLPNRWGFFDMQGNVLQVMCEHMHTLTGSTQNQNWQPIAIGRDDGTLADFLAARGGAWNMGAVACEATIRRAINISSRCYHIGFRLACGPTLPPINNNDRNTWIFDRDYLHNMKSYMTIMSAHNMSR